MRTYWLASTASSVLTSVALVAYLLWTGAHPARSNAESWAYARQLLLGVGLAGVLGLNAVVANVAAVAKGAARPATGGTLIAVVLVGAAAVWWAKGR
jgi:hypothetical protein